MPETCVEVGHVVVLECGPGLLLGKRGSNDCEILKAITAMSKNGGS